MWARRKSKNKKKEQVISPKEQKTETEEVMPDLPIDLGKIVLDYWSMDAEQPSEICKRLTFFGKSWQDLLSLKASSVAPYIANYILKVTVDAEEQKTLHTILGAASSGERAIAELVKKIPHLLHIEITVTQPNALNISPVTGTILQFVARMQNIIFLAMLIKAGNLSAEEVRKQIKGIISEDIVKKACKEEGYEYKSSAGIFGFG